MHLGWLGKTSERFSASSSCWVVLMATPYVSHLKKFHSHTCRSGKTGYPELTRSLVAVMALWSMDGVQTGSPRGSESWKLQHRLQSRLWSSARACLSWSAEGLKMKSWAAAGAAPAGLGKALRLSWGPPLPGPIYAEGSQCLLNVKEIPIESYV